MEFLTLNLDVHFEKFFVQNVLLKINKDKQ